MIRLIKDSFEREDFVAFYKGNKFYTGILGDTFANSLEKILKRDSSAYIDVLKYIDHAIDARVSEDLSEFEVATMFTQILYNEACDGDDYWNFGDFEIFPEYELDESIKRNKNNKRSIKEELDSSSYEDLKYEVYRAAERAFNSFVRNNEMSVSDDEITSIMREVTAKLLESVIEL